MSVVQSEYKEQHDPTPTKRETREMLEQIKNSPDGVMQVSMDMPSEKHRLIKHLDAQGLIAWVGDSGVRVSSKGLDQLAGR